MQTLIRPSTCRKFAGKLSVCLLAALCCSLLNVNKLFADEDPVVRLDTTRGTIFIRVLRSMVPMTSNNFLDIVSRGFYSGKIFHRIENWCIQGGDPNGNGSGAFVDPSTGQPRYIRLEINRNLRHSAGGVVAMARGSSENSASCQFYILKCPMFQLDGKYAIFGRVVGGMDVVNAMRRGDAIRSAVILAGSNQQQGGGQSPNGGQRRPRQQNVPVVPYTPPGENEIPDSGF